MEGHRSVGAPQGSYGQGTAWRRWAVEGPPRGCGWVLRPEYWGMNPASTTIWVISASLSPVEPQFFLSVKWE